MTYEFIVQLGQLPTVTDAQKAAFKKLANQAPEVCCNFQGFRTQRLADKDFVLAMFTCQGKQHARICEPYFRGMAVSVINLVV